MEISESSWIGSGQWKVAALLWPQSGKCITTQMGTTTSLQISSECTNSIGSTWPAIITAFFRTTDKRILVNIIQCCASTNDTDHQIEEDFQNQFQSEISQKETSV